MAVTIKECFKLGSDVACYLSNDEICDFEVFNAYYVLGEYELFLEECEKAEEDCDLSGGPYYFGLWIKSKKISVFKLL